MRIFLLYTFCIYCTSSHVTLNWEMKTEFNSPYNYVVQGAVLGYLNSTQTYYYMGGLPSNGVTLRVIYSWNVQDKVWKQSSFTFHDGFMVDDQQYIIYNDTFYIFNPYNFFLFSGEVWTFDGINPVIRYTAIQTEMQYPISFGCSVSNGSHVFVIGGQPATGQYVQYVQLFELKTMKYVNSSIYVPIPVQIAHQTCQYYSITNSIYVFGGFIDSNPGCSGAVDWIWKFDITKNVWKLLNATMSSGRAYFGSVIRRINNTDYVYLIGGRTKPCATLNTVDIFELDTEDCYISINSSLINPVETASIFVADNGILLIGGNNYGIGLYHQAYIASYSEHNRGSNDWSLFGLNMVQFVIISICLGVGILSCLFYCIWRKRNQTAVVINENIMGNQNNVEMRRSVSQQEGNPNAQTALL